MIERLISFAGSGSDAYGAIALGAGTGNGAACAALAGSGETLALSDATATRGEGTLRIAGAGGELILGLAAQTSPLAFETGPGRKLTLQAIGASAELGGAAAERLGAGFEATGVSWTLEGEQDQAGLRTAWAALADGSLLALFGLRPTGEAPHGEETVGAARIDKDGSVTAYAEPLLSTEYDAEGRHTRATLELWTEEQGVLPTRGAGSRMLGCSGRIGAGTLAAARFGWRLDGAPGFGAYEIFG